MLLSKSLSYDFEDPEDKNKTRVFCTLCGGGWITFRIPSCNIHHFQPCEHMNIEKKEEIHTMVKLIYLV